jgi:hypothetical protein
MKTVDRRLCKLEDQFGTGNRKPPLPLVACKAGWGLALDVGPDPRYGYVHPNPRRVRVLAQCFSRLGELHEHSKRHECGANGEILAGTRASGNRDTHKGVIVQRMP